VKCIHIKRQIHTVTLQESGLCPNTLYQPVDGASERNAGNVAATGRATELTPIQRVLTD